MIRKSNPSHIEVFGARVHNLKNIDVRVPLNEFVGIAVLNYKPEYGDVTATLEFGTPYQAGQKIYPVTNIGGEWTAETAEAQEDGTVKITFTGEELQKMMESTNMMGVLSAPVAE